MEMSEVREELLQHFLRLINGECMMLCRKSSPSKFRHIPVDQFDDFEWKEFMDELESNSPLLLKVLSTVAIRSDPRYKNTPKSEKYPGIVTAAAVLLKQRNREMCGIPSLISLLMYSGHCEKQVHNHENYYYKN